MPKQIIIAIALAGTILLAFFLVYPKYQDLGLTKKQLEEKKEEFSYQQDYFSELSLLKEKLADYQEALEKINSALPKEPLLPELFDYFQKTSAQNGLILSSISAGAFSVSELNPDIQKIIFTISVSGTYSAFKNFLNSLYKSAKMIEIEDISFSAGGEEKEEEGGEAAKLIFEFNLQLKTHYFSPKIIETEAGAAPIPEAEIMWGM